MSRGRRERGHLMVGLMAAVAILTILSTVGFQAWTDVVRRDNEAEMMFRAQEIVRALRRYQRDQGAFPDSLEKLMGPGNKQQYFLRHLYKDPLVKGGKWGLLYMSPAGGIYDPHGEEAGVGIDEFGTQAQQTGGSASPFPTRTGGSSAPGAAAGEEQGLPIAGVKSLCTDKPFRVFRDQTEYSKWQFTVCDRDILGNMAMQCAQSEGTPPPTGGTPPPTGSHPPPGINPKQ